MLSIEIHRTFAFLYVNEEGYATLQIGWLLFGWDTNQENDSEH